MVAGGVFFLCPPPPPEISAVHERELCVYCEEGRPGVILCACMLHVVSAPSS